ncbi:OpgC domain-containing protein [Gordonia sp. PP30]|uniref:OpgC domain-containing protein n=1 Tax=Gordonia sp. PP30 TaxID=2935861 RepID=UPI001FFFF1E5|nr:OpgC domain-containing protein [Gordonia sp. PP30]UQE76402.1 OpgC domain-containing protein [Gordonia sp. PP30]
MRRHDDATPRSGRAPAGRDLAIDATRGLAIWSMISLHFANGMLIARPTHSFPLVDGMSAFVLLSGLILGLVYRGWIERQTLGYAYHRLAQRLLVLYVAQVTISLAAVAVGLVLSGRDFRTITNLPAGEPLVQQVWWALTLRFLPGGGSILVVYLVLMTLAFAILPALARGAWAAVLAVSGALYVYSQVAPAWWMYLNSSPDGGPVQNWLAWQVLFVPAMVLGWKWHDWQLPARLDASFGVLAATTVAVGALLYTGLHGPRLLARAPELIGKVDLGPLRALVAWLAVITVYAAFRQVQRRTRRDWLAPLATVGARSLDAYVIQAVALLAIPVLVVFRPWGPGVSTLIVLAVFGACWGWARFRQRAGIDKLHRLPAEIARIRRRRVEGVPAQEGTHDDTTRPHRSRQSRRGHPQRARRELVGP